ncbi:TATA box-binding protein [Candidatus Nitrosotenuis sp. DW1]|uniref:TATA box-binding protein n=1 Tax=Candidatus Nitrosotenuis sp. DW1 TaxID=2259672 RepID=UPI0015C70570|nr:TATA box-binding protein [Candidatus Nitrosotenuis sp. DW1]QLH09469.1 TATA box-binding protein [Candidatus Nitrosotenuis sp. DW1]
MQVLDVLRKEISIQNVVCTADLKQPVDIASFNEFKHLSSNLDLYRCGYVKDNKMTGRVTVFASGKLISVGTRYPEQAYEELQRAGDILKKYKLIRSFKVTPKLQNIVARFDLGKKIALEELARTMPKSMYEPEQFPGLIFRIQDSCVALIFASGKGVLVGAKTISELNQGLFEVEKWINY